MSLEWMIDRLTGLPGADDTLFQNLWEGQRLMFDGQRGVADTVDYFSARLVAATLRKGDRLLISLPDFQPHRSAFLLATGLIRHFLDSRDPSARFKPRDGPVVYLGSTVGIRDQLRRTSVVGLHLNLSEVFSQEHVRRGAVGKGRLAPVKLSVSDRLPTVITVFAPVDPVSLIAAYKPSWIAIECGDAASLLWLRPLLEYATDRGLCIIAWGQNALSECVVEFASHGKTFVWPPLLRPTPGYKDGAGRSLENVLSHPDLIHMAPIILQGISIDGFSSSINEAAQLLARAAQCAEGQLEKDCIAVHWRYLRSLEALSVPIDFYEAEAPGSWGLRSIGALRSACEHFRAAVLVRDQRVYGALEEAAQRLADAEGSMEGEGCALWNVLTTLCIEDSPAGEARILVFTSDARKRLFLFAMLARLNTSEDDLHAMRIRAVSLNDLRRWSHSRDRGAGQLEEDDPLVPPERTGWHPVLVGLPSPRMTPRLIEALLYPTVDIVLYPHQYSTLLRRQAEWSVYLNGDPRGNVATLARLTGSPMPKVTEFPPTRLMIHDPLAIDVATSVRVRKSDLGAMWVPDDSVDELARLFQDDDAVPAEEVVIGDQTETGAQDYAVPSGEIWCDHALRLQFDQGWHALFSEDDVLNVIQDGKLDLRFVRSLRAGDRVLFIYGQQRQSLYELIVSRVHMHPSVELHLALIRRWQEDLRVAYRTWRTLEPSAAEARSDGQRDLSGLLHRMQLRGSSLVSAFTVSLWLRGFVMAPLDPEDMRRVAEVLDIGFIRQHYKRIAVAANRLRGLHRGLSIRLNNWLQDHALGATGKGEDDLIDAELGLTFGDVKNSLLLLRVIAIESVYGAFLHSNLGQAERDVQ